MADSISLYQSPGWPRSSCADPSRTSPRFWDEKSCLKLVFATLVQTGEYWQNVRMSDIEVAMLMQLRRELGLEPPAQRQEGQPAGQRQVA